MLAYTYGEKQIFRPFAPECFGYRQGHLAEKIVTRTHEQIIFSPRNIYFPASAALMCNTSHQLAKVLLLYNFFFIKLYLSIKLLPKLYNNFFYRARSNNLITFRHQEIDLKLTNEVFSQLQYNNNNNNNNTILNI